jgi:sporulation protein YlmC with PRC-barrel domain
MSSPGFLKREDLIGKSVVSKNAQIVGTVLDLAISTDGKLAVQVQRKSDQSGTDSGDLFISADEIQAVGDVILLKGVPGSPSSSPAVVPATTASSQPTPAVVTPPPPPGSSSSMGKTCQKCGYVNSANAKFCIKCGSSLQP